MSSSFYPHKICFLSYFPVPVTLISLCSPGVPTEVSVYENSGGNVACTAFKTQARPVTFCFLFSLNIIIILAFSSFSLL